MELRESESEQAFRAELRAWLARAVPEHGPFPGDDEDGWGWRDYELTWQRKLHAAGYAGITWPEEFGGRDLPPSLQLIYHEELARAKAPWGGATFVGLNHGGPTLIAEGTAEQKARHLPSILRGDEIWCQGFSEPGAGSDLASLRTRAVREGDHYVVTGQKIWTSFATVADFCELLVRTDPNAPRHRGISWLILPMDSPGVEARPLRTLHGGGEFCEVFLEGVRVPVENRVGAENDGWRVSNVTLRFERGTAFAGQIYRTGELLSDLATIARKVTRDDARAWDDSALRRELGRLSAELEGLWALVKLSVSEAERTGLPGLSGSAVKLAYTEILQRAGDVARELAGRAGLALEDLDGFPNRRLAMGALSSLSLSIGAGTSEIQRNIIAERILGLPRR